jgi:hypothetical protein
MSYPNQEDHNVSDDGELLDIDGDRIGCAACDNMAVSCVAVSVREPHDEVRHYCHTCYLCYTVGVQHGRFHEAKRHGVYPGRDSSQEKPT